MVHRIDTSGRPGALRLLTATARMALVLAIALAGVSAPAEAQNATQRLLDAKRRQETGQAGPASPAGGAATQGDAVVIEAKGVASWYQADPARSRDEAIEAAQRDAVEQASGIIISSETQMRNFDLVSDDVLSRSKGFIRNYEVIKEGQDGAFYNVAIRANVVKQAFVKDFEDALENLYQRVGKPRVMLVVNEFEAGNGSGNPVFEGEPAKALNVVEKEIRKILLKQGFTFIDARALTKGSVVEKAKKGANTDHKSMLDDARTSKAELVMVGRGRISSKGMLQKFNIVEASVGLDVIRTDNGQVMASDVSMGKGLHINEDTAAVIALQKAAEDITPKIMEQVTYLWLKERNEGRRIEMVVKNAGFGDVLTLRRALGNEVKGVKKVRQKSFSDGVALLEVESRDGPDRLAESLYDAQFDGFKLKIEDVTATTLTVSLVKNR